jgi:uncharacterized protein
MATDMVRTGDIDRRQFMRAAGIGFLAALSPQKLYALERADAVFAAGFRSPDGAYGIATTTADGEIIDRIALPARAHGLAYCRVSGRGVAFARRPGTFAMIFDPKGVAQPVLIHAPEGRHYYGHGYFSPDGRLLYASENDFDGNRGMIGLYDATNGFARIGPPGFRPYQAQSRSHAAIARHSGRANRAYGGAPCAAASPQPALHPASGCR